MNTVPDVSLGVAILFAAVFVLAIGGLQLLLAWAAIQKLPEEEQPKAWHDFLVALSLQRPSGL